jgi:plastocyanin
MDAVSFQPNILTLRAGDTVTRTNKDPFSHTVVAENRAFKSGSIAPGMSWKHTIATKGAIRYFCTLHTTMKATLEVQ